MGFLAAPSDVDQCKVAINMGSPYPGVGFGVWRGNEYLPEDVVFRVNYLGGDM
uniref:GadD n=1 Tax=Mycobacterium leprae TaxID=1769 RepID=Q49863_MYCLR|nr:gadD [Mycobacterium leprae]